MKTEQDLKEFHEQNVLKYTGKETDKGIIEEIQYLTFTGNNGGYYSTKPQLKGKGLICGVIGTKAIPIGELKFISTVEA